MLRFQRNGRVSQSDPLGTPNLIDLGATVVAFRPRRAAENRSSLPPFAIAPSRSTFADIIPFQSRRSALRSRVGLSTLPATDKYRKAGVSKPPDSEMGDDEYHQRTFENLIAVAWVAVLMAAAYYLFSNLLAMP